MGHCYLSRDETTGSEQFILYELLIANLIIHRYSGKERITLPISSDKTIWIIRVQFQLLENE